MRGRMIRLLALVAVLALALAAEAIARARDKAPAYDTRAAIIAARASGRSGAVAFQSR